MITWDMLSQDERNTAIALIKAHGSMVTGSNADKLLSAAADELKSRESLFSTYKRALVAIESGDGDASEIARSALDVSEERR